MRNGTPYYDLFVGSSNLTGAALNTQREWNLKVSSLANGELVAPRQRCVSTSNRNFVGRQGPMARTHLASPRLAVECAVAGCIVDHLDTKGST